MLDLEMMNNTNKKLGLLVIIGSILLISLIVNITVFGFMTMRIGGAAAIGKIENGKYFVGEHGNYTEVDKKTYLYSQCHENLIYIHLFLTCIFGFAYWIKEGIKKKNLTNQSTRQ